MKKDERLGSFLCSPNAHARKGHRTASLEGSLNYGRTLGPIQATRFHPPSLLVNFNRAQVGSGFEVSLQPSEEGAPSARQIVAIHPVIKCGGYEGVRDGQGPDPTVPEIQPTPEGSAQRRQEHDHEIGAVDHAEGQSIQPGQSERMERGAERAHAAKQVELKEGLLEQGPWPVHQDGGGNVRVENSRLCSRPAGSLIADRNSYEQQHEYRQRRKGHSDHRTLPPPSLFSFERPLSPDGSPGVVRVEEDETHGEQRETEVRGDRSSWKQHQETARQDTQDQQLNRQPSSLRHTSAPDNRTGTAIGACHLQNNPTGPSRKSSCLGMKRGQSVEVGPVIEFP